MIFERRAIQGSKGGRGQDVRSRENIPEHLKRDLLL